MMHPYSINELRCVIRLDPVLYVVYHFIVHLDDRKTAQYLEFIESDFKKRHGNHKKSLIKNFAYV